MIIKLCTEFMLTHCVMSINGTQFPPMEREAVARLKRQCKGSQIQQQQSTAELRVRSGLQALMNTSLWRYFHMKIAAWLLRCHINTGWVWRYAPNRVNTFLSQSFTLNWTWRHCQIQSWCRGAKQNLQERNLPNLVLDVSEGWGLGGRGGIWGRSFSKPSGIFVSWFMSTALMTMRLKFQGTMQQIPASNIFDIKNDSLVNSFFPSVSWRRLKLFSEKNNCKGELRWFLVINLDQFSLIRKIFNPKYFQMSSLKNQETSKQAIWWLLLSSRFQWLKTSTAAQFLQKELL